VLGRIQRQAITISPRPTPICSCCSANV
jgi:hypothetical protein